MIAAINIVNVRLDTCANVTTLDVNVIIILNEKKHIFFFSLLVVVVVVVHLHF